MDPMSKMFEEAKRNPKMRKKLKMKAAFTLLLSVMFLGVIFITVGTILASKHGSFIGMTQLDFLRLRSRYGLIMTALILIHLGMNWNILKKEIEFLMS
ncbi:hypothetical protein [Thermococcus sp.]